MYLGIDTSCYTTSVAVVDKQGQLLGDERRVLHVKPGQRGLRQSEGFFQHIQNLPDLLRKMAEQIDISALQAVCVSSAPRNVQGSYMPVFTAGMAIAKTIALTLGIPLYTTSHQEGHIMAAEWSAKAPESKERISVHLSGGTTEILHTLSTDGGYLVDILGKSLDLHAGQLIDRLGVAAGLPFPCGKQLDILASQSEKTIKIPISVKGYDMNLSGAEAVALGALKKGEDIGAIAKGVFQCIGESLCRIIREIPGFIPDVVMAGGVSANTIIKMHIKNNLKQTVYFGQPEYATDNAVGVALIGRKKGM